MCVCVCVCVSLSVIRCNNKSLHLQCVGTERRTKEESKSYALYYGGLGFRSRPKDRLPSLLSVVFSVSLSKQVLEHYLKLDHSHPN
jgi:hypothetical protein